MFLVRPNKTRRRLNDSAVPSIFNFPSHLQPKPRQPRKARKQPAEDSDGSSHMGHVLEDQDAPSPAKIARRINIEHSYISGKQPLSPKMVQKTAKIKEENKDLDSKS